METEGFLKIYGSRGTVPVCEEDYRIYGGNTSCSAIILSAAVLIFDAGTGIRALGAEWKGKKKEYHIFISHLHIDHIQALPLFTPLYDKEAKVFIYGEKKDERGIRERLYDYLATTLWPIGEEAFSCQLSYVDMEAGKKIRLATEEEVWMEAMPVRHVGGSTAYRCWCRGSSIVYALDFEHGGGAEDKLGEFSQNAEIMIYDGQYFPEEYEKKKNWGHSTWEEGLKLQEGYGIKKLLIAHHEPWHTDREIQEEEKKIPQSKQKKICFAKEGMVLSLGDNRCEGFTGDRNCSVAGKGQE